MSGVVLANSVGVALVTAVLATGLGTIVAAAALGAGHRGRWTMVVAGIVALAMPSFFATAVWLSWFGLAGAGATDWTARVWSLGGTVAILVVLYWPVAFLLVLGAWSRVDAAQFEVEPRARGWWLVRWLMLPTGQSAMVTAGMIVLVLAMNNFTVPALLQVRVYPSEVWIQFNTHLDAWAALRSSWPMVLLPLLLLGLFARRRASLEWPAFEQAVSPERFRSQLGWSWYAASAVLAGAALVLSVGLPLAEVVFDGRTWSELGAAVRAGRQAVWNSALFSGAGAVVVVVLGLGSWRFRWGIWFWFPFLVPGVLLGVVLILTLNRPPFLSLYRGAGMVVLAYAIRYGVIGWSGARQAMLSTERGVVEAGQIDGARGMSLLGAVYWPQVAPRLGATWMLVYLFCLWDVETLLLIAPPGCESLAGRIFGLLHYGHNAQVSALCLVLLGLAVAPPLTWLLAVVGRGLWDRCRGGVHRVMTVILLVGVVSTGCGRPGETEGTQGSSLFERVEVIGGRGTGLGQFHKPRSVAVDRDDNLYVVDMTGRVQKFSPAGLYLAYWQFPEGDRGQPKGMGLDEAGNVVVVEPHYARVNHFTPTGRLVEQWGAAGTAPGQLSFPRAVAVRADGDVWVSEYGIVERVQRFRAKDRAWLKVLGGSSLGEPAFNRAEGLALDQAQRLYVADSCNHRIQVFDPEGSFLRAHGRAGEAPGELSYPYDVRVDAAGRQYVCEFGNSRIQVFDAVDRPLEVLGGAGSAPGRLNNPWSIALDSRGNLYVADTLNHRVQKWVARRGGVVGP